MRYACAPLQTYGLARGTGSLEIVNIINLAHILQGIGDAG